METEQATNTGASEQPVQKQGNSKMVIIVIIVVVLAGMAWSTSRRFTADRIVERAIEEGGAREANVDTRPDGGSSVTVTDKDGTKVTYEAGGNVSLPSDWPSDVPVMEGITLNYAGSSNPQTGQPAKVVTGMTKTAAAEVIAFYKNALSSNGWTEESSLNMNGTLMYVARKGTSQVGIYVAGDENGTTVTLSINS